MWAVLSASCLQQMDLSIGEHSPGLPGLKRPSQQRTWPPGQQGAPAPLAERAPPSPDSCRAAVDPLDPTTPGNITIPRPQGRKTPELGRILPLPVGQSRSRPPGAAGGPTSGGQEFRQALSQSAEEERAQAGASSEEGLDLLSLLDPLSSSAHSCCASAGDGGALAAPRATPPGGPSPQGLPPFSLHPPVVFNPFAHASSSLHFLPSPSANPFAAALGPHPGPYLHPRAPSPPFSALTGLYRQQAASVSAPPPSGPLQESRTPPPRPSQDPFGDLLMVAKTGSRVEKLQRQWETFE